MNLYPSGDKYIESVKSYYENIIGRLPCYVFWKNRNFVYLGCNNLTAQLLHLPSRQHIVGKTDYDFGWDNSLVDSYRAIDENVVYNGNAILNMEETVMMGDQIVYLLVNKEPLLNERNEIIGMLGISIDITERKKMEEELRIAKIAAETANHAKTEFLANISHDIRTPLSGIVGMAEILENDLTSNLQKKHARDLGQSGHELLNMLNEILDVVQAGELTSSDLNPTPFSIHHLIQSIVNLEYPSTLVKEIELRTQIDPNIPPVLICDHKKLYHVLLNLVGNAIKFTHTGHIDIKITLLDKTDDTVRLEFQIIDTGKGIPTNALQHIFDRFFRVEPSYKGREKGHGLGLHFAQSYTELLGGKIEVTSQLDVGSRFFFTLTMPIEKAELVVTNNISHPQPIDHASPSPESDTIQAIAKTPDNALHILIIEDNHIALNIVDLMLKQAEFSSTPATNGEVALELATTQHFDFIFSDVGLPGISGIEFTQQLRSFEKKHARQPVPIVGLTAHGDGKTHIECLKAGMNDIMIKPLSLPILKAMIAKYTSHMG
jgi:signal transduction histidine kinase/ActR/RegA family two-component response regulator